MTRGQSHASGDITGANLQAAFANGLAYLQAHAARVDALNVFPVPDGDTGTNMSLTLKEAVAAGAALPQDADVAAVAQAISHGALMGARGNSGVILSQVLRGFACAIPAQSTIDASEFAAALVAGSHTAYEAISRPVEGTILTVAREAGQAAAASGIAAEGLVDVLDRAVNAAAAAVANTPNQLAVLRKAGVVDSGGEGYRVMLEGMLRWARGEPLESAVLNASVEPVFADLTDFADHTDAGFGFCTEFLLQGCTADLAEVRTRMEKLGDSVIAVGDATAMRIHVHTPRPGRALDFAVDHGTVTRVKVENMALQHRALADAASHSRAGADESTRAPTARVVAVVSGSGLRAVFQDLGAAVVDGGSTMNPSVKDILAALETLEPGDAILLPNDGNVLLAAEHVRQVASRRVGIVPTVTVPQGISALLAYNFQADLDTNVQSMEAATRAVRTIEVSYASRAAEVDGVAVLPGHAFSILDGKVVASAELAVEALLAGVQHAEAHDRELLTVYVGRGISPQEVESIAPTVRERFPHLHVEYVSGDQPHYPLIAAIE